jgi:hypothetical protein
LSTRSRQKVRNFFGHKIKSPVYLSPEQKEYILKELKDDLNKLKCDYQVNINSWDINI